MALFRRLCGLSVLLSCLAVASARLRDGRLHANIMRPATAPSVSAPKSNSPVTSRNGTILPPYNTTFFFDQLIDHNNPSLGTFKQRFWHTWEFYEKGGPIILSTPGEANAEGFDGYLTNLTINGQIAQQQNGSTIVIEHRFFGLSNPHPDLSVESLKVLNIQQAIDDLEYFAKNVNLPMPGGDSVTPDKAPWILVGGSYAGALTSWTMVNKPNLFAAGYASSAVVESIVDFWGYFEPIRQNMPANCSADVQAVIARVDETFLGKNETAIQAIKDNFGIGDVTHLDDAAGALRNNLWDWQDLQPVSGPGTQFTEFCDALEVKDGVSASAFGWGVDHALAAWGEYWRSTYLNLICGTDNAQDCLGTYNTSQSFWLDTTIDNADRSWMWFVCNQVGFLQDGAPVTSPTLVTRLVQPIYDLRQCQQMFPAAFPVPTSPNVLATNKNYDGWNVQIKNLFFATATRDPWREATLSADGLNKISTPSQPIAESDGFHCSDLLTENNVDATVVSVQAKGLASIKTWLAAWKPTDNGAPVTSPRSVPAPPQNASPVTHVKPINAWFKSFGGR